MKRKQIVDGGCGVRSRRACCVLCVLRIATVRERLRRHRSSDGSTGRWEIEIVEKNVLLDRAISCTTIPHYIVFVYIYNKLNCYYHILSEFCGGGVKSKDYDSHAACRGREGHNGTRLPASREQLSGVGRLVVCAVRSVCNHWHNISIITVCSCMQRLQSF